MNGHCDRCGSLTQTGEELISGLCEACLKEDFNKKQLKLDKLYEKIPKELRDLVSEIVELEIEQEEECE